ncbi:MAG: AAA family ATPase [Synechococcales cyanobacterium K44_A2020_017]|nr:AAA family ATPase [Synechococcales cyanobacterium K44_A2020_017]
MTPLETTNPHLGPEISGYRITEQLYLGSRTAVYRAVHIEQQSPVVIKVMRREYPSFSELVQFRNQYTITQNLPIPGIVKPLGLEPLGSGYALILEDTGGVSLGTYTQQQTLELTEILAIALQIATILHDLCQHRVVHKDIKPANILIHPESKHIKLIDFSIASLLPKENQEIQSPNILEGTLAYFAPEQTGRMNRGIDYRTDFYALGVTLYQLLTGTLPFVSDDPLELIHSHIAKVPIPVDQVNPSIPERVAAIVAKLMAKNAEDRYQNAMGLKHDLEQCLNQWETQGAIAKFPLGERDFSDRFLIPEKLYGREAEVQSLLAAFDRVAEGSSELMLIAGFSGIGKTAVVNEVHKPIVQRRGYFIKGKYDQFNRNIPLSAFVQALRDLIRQLLSESDTQLAQWKTKILTALGENGQVLIEVIPELEQVIGKQPMAPELPGSAAQNRFNLLFQKFIEVFTISEHPLVLFLDDLQWADSTSLQLIKLLMNGNGYLLMLGAYRDNEVSPVHPFIAMVEDLKKTQAIVHTITLAPLALSDINRLIADTLHCSLTLSQPLTQLVNRKTQGNPLFTTQFLKVLHEDGYISFDAERRHWKYDTSQVNSLALTDDVVDFISLQLQKLPTETQQALKLAACVGNQFDLATLAIISAQSPNQVAATLWRALQEGLILPTSQIYKFFQGADNSNAQTNAQNSDTPTIVNPTYRFLHDRIQQAAYALIPEDQKKITHLSIGRLLLQNTSDLNSILFEVVNHWNIASDSLENLTEKEQLTNLNWLAGCKAKAAVAYEPALQYFRLGLESLAADCWQTNYDLTFNLYKEAAKMASICGDYRQMEQWSEIVLQESKTILEKVKVYDIQIQAQMAQSKPAVGIQIALEALQLLDLTLPQSPTPDDIQSELLKTKCLWESQDISQLSELPLMTDSEKLAAIIILSSIFAPSFIAKPDILPLIACQQVRLSIQYGNCEYSAFGYSNYSAILNTVCHDLEASYKFGQLAIDLVDKLNAKAVKARTFNQAAIFSIHGKVHLRESTSILQEGCRSGIENGDLEFAGYAAYNWSQYSYFSGLNLAALKEGAKNYALLLTQTNQKISLSCSQIVHQVVLNLTEKSNDPCCLMGEAFNEEEGLKQFLNDQVFSGVQYLFLHKVVLACFFSRFEQLLEKIDWSERYLSASTGMVVLPAFYFFATLGRLQIYMTQSPENQAKLWLQIEQGLAEISRWAEQAPMNFQHKLDLLMAERSRVLNEIHLAIALYDQAIAGAKENGYIQEEALANELAAKFYLAWGKEKIAQDYLTHAYYSYAHWGAKAKVQDLEQRYPLLLLPILYQQRLALSTTETMVGSEPLTTLQTSSAQNSTSGNTSISASFDLATVLKASQTLSSEIQLDKLLATLLHTVLENAGAGKGALLMPHHDQWFVEAVAVLDQPARIESIALSNSLEVPQGLINRVKRSQQPVVIIDAAADLNLATDDYVKQQHPKSMLCTPILQQGKLVAILYLENQVTAGAFTRDRVELLNFLCAQAAISLENARLYQQAKNYARQIEQSQLQIVQSEKMASLGNLVAGIAHEINNPMGFLNGSISNAKAYVQDLLDYLALYQKHHPDAALPVQAKAQEIDLDFLCEDFPKLVNSMQGATDRIKGISTSLRIFSRADTEYKVRANLHEGIDSTLLILKYRLQANEYRPAIQVIKDYGDVPPIQCFPGKLNQVFMNILANAIDVLDEGAQQSSETGLAANPPKITIQTTLTSQNAIEIRIGDNGKGIPPAFIAKIFDYLFTTKELGKGTGLGLAIARQIILENHGGNLEVESEVGQGTVFCIHLPIDGA